MTLIDGLIVIGIFVGFGYIILIQLKRKNPNMMEGIKNWFREKPEILNTKSIQEKMQQIYPEKRWGM